MFAKSLTTLAFLGLTALSSGCGTGEASVTAAAEDEIAVPVAVTAPRRSDIYATYAATTTIGSEGDAPVIARVPGELVELLVEEGDAVEAGQVLARLDGERLRLEMLAAEAELQKTRGEYERYLDLNRRGLVSEAMFDSLRYELDALQARYELRKLDYGYTNIRATIAGVVSDRSVKLGQNVTTGTPVFRITDTAQLIAYLQIPQTEIGKFAPGHAATVQVDSLPEREFGARILRISPTIDPVNGTFRAAALIDNSERLLAPGMFARFRIAYEKHENALTIPAVALIEEDDESTVYVVEDGAVARRVITVGIRSDGRVEILRGLSEDDRVVVVGQGALREGSRVVAQLDDHAAPKG